LRQVVDKQGIILFAEAEVPYPGFGKHFSPISVASGTHSVQMEFNARQLVQPIEVHAERRFEFGPNPESIMHVLA
jgi:hypothetical protein